LAAAVDVLLNPAPQKPTPETWPRLHVPALDHHPPDGVVHAAFGDTTRVPAAHVI